MPNRVARRPISLSVLLAFASGALMLVGVGSVLIISIGGAGRNTEELLADKVDLILSSIEQQIRQHLGPVVAQADTSRTPSSSNNSIPTTHESLRQHCDRPWPPHLK